MSNRGQRPRYRKHTTKSLPGGQYAAGRTKRFIPVYRLGEDGDLKNEGDGMLSVWALRARSYKTKAEA